MRGSACKIKRWAKGKNGRGACVCVKCVWGGGMKGAAGRKMPGMVGEVPAAVLFNPATNQTQPAAMVAVMAEMVGLG